MDTINCVDIQTPPNPKKPNCDKVRGGGVFCVQRQVLVVLLLMRWVA